MSAASPEYLISKSGVYGMTGSDSLVYTGTNLHIYVCGSVYDSDMGITIVCRFLIVTIVNIIVNDYS